MIEILDRVNLIGSPKLLDDISGIALYHDYLFFVDDEDDRVRKYRKLPHGYEAVEDVNLMVNKDGKESDLEAIAIDGNVLYALGSHSCRRKKTKPTLSYTENLARLERVEPAGYRDLLARFELNPDGTVHSSELTSLRAIIDNLPVIRMFAGIPSKENGVDIEGLAVKAGRLLAGFRGPVLNDGFVPVLECRWNWKEKLKFERVMYLDLGSRGIRDLLPVRGGFLVMAGATSELTSSFELYFWNGECRLPGGRGEIRHLGSVPVPNPKAKAEGILLESENDSGYTIWVAFDGVPDGGITRMHVTIDPSP